MTTSSTCAGVEVVALLQLRRAAPASRSIGLTSCRLPSFLPLPRGVRTASKIMACGISAPRDGGGRKRGCPALTSDYPAGHTAPQLTKQLLGRRSSGASAALHVRLSIDLRARPVARPGGARHRRRLGHRPLHRARAGGARRRGRDRRPQGRQARTRCGREIEDAGGACSTHVCDIRDEAAVQSTVAAVLARHGRIDALVNNAGGQFPSPLAAISAKGWDAVVRNNLTGGFLFARECVNQWMRRRADGGGASSTSSPTCGAACRAWATRARRAPACSTSPRRRRSSGRRCASTRSRRAGSRRAAWTTTRPRWRRRCAA